jgi:hypothetical protein
MQRKPRDDASRRSFVYPVRLHAAPIGATSAGRRKHRTEKDVCRLPERQRRNSAVEWN